jgi:hypothetical protein
MDFGAPTETCLDNHDPCTLCSQCSESSDHHERGVLLQLRDLVQMLASQRLAPPLADSR